MDGWKTRYFVVSNWFSDGEQLGLSFSIIQAYFPFFQAVLLLFCYK